MCYVTFSIHSDVRLTRNKVDGIVCRACNFAPMVHTVLTTGDESMQIERCPNCDGEGCAACMLHGNTVLASAEDAVAHLNSHVDRGDKVPDYAFERLYEELKDEQAASQT